MTGLSTNDPEMLRQTAELCLIIAGRTPHMPQHREELLRLAAECMARANEADPHGVQRRSLITELHGSASGGAVQ